MPKTLEERIVDLEGIIKRYDDEYAAATTTEDKKELRALITASRKTLNALLKEKQGKLILDSILF
jgi:hypothetical protein